MFHFLPRGKCVRNEVLGAPALCISTPTPPRRVPLRPGDLAQAVPSAQGRGARGCKPERPLHSGDWVDRLFQGTESKSSLRKAHCYGSGVA